MEGKVPNRDTEKGKGNLSPLIQGEEGRSYCEGQKTCPRIEKPGRAGKTANFYQRRGGWKTSATADLYGRKKKDFLWRRRNGEVLKSTRGEGTTHQTKRRLFRKEKDSRDEKGRDGGRGCMG